MFVTSLSIWPGGHIFSNQQLAEKIRNCGELLGSLQNESHRLEKFNQQEAIGLEFIHERIIDRRIAGGYICRDFASGVRASEYIDLPGNSLSKHECAKTDGFSFL